MSGPDIIEALEQAARGDLVRVTIFVAGQRQRWVRSDELGKDAARIAELEESRKTIELPRWNYLTAAQRDAIADGILLPHPEERMQMAVEAYAAVRRALLSESSK